MSSALVGDMTPNKILLLAVLISVLGLGGIIAIFGISIVTAALVGIFWRTILPGLMILFGLILVVYGAHRTSTKIAAVGMTLIITGLVLSLYMG